MALYEIFYDLLEYWNDKVTYDSKKIKLNYVLRVMLFFPL
jgi:hypothetical protein